MSTSVNEQGKGVRPFPATYKRRRFLIMEMPERIKVNTDKTLTVYLDDNEFLFNQKQYLKSDKGKILLKHQTVRQLAEVAGVSVGPPVLISTHNPVVYVFMRCANKGNYSVTEIGESNGQNLFDDIMKINPATTADNRAYERAVLKLLGIYGEVYGASEINYKDGEKPPAASGREPKLNNDSDNSAVLENAEKAAVTNIKASQTEDGKPFWWNDTGIGSFKESELDPETAIVTQGPCAGKDWTVKQLYDFKYTSCVYFAERKNLDTASDDFKKQVYACRRAIRKYGLKEEN